MKRIFAWSVALALLGMLAACAGERPATETTTTANSAASEQLPMHTGFSLEKLPAGDLVWEAQPMPFPKPPAERFGVRGGLLICHGVGERAFAAYQKALAADGWRQFFRSEESESNEQRKLPFSGGDGPAAIVIKKAGHIHRECARSLFDSQEFRRRV